MKLQEIVGVSLPRLNSLMWMLPAMMWLRMPTVWRVSPSPSLRKPRSNSVKKMAVISSLWPAQRKPSLLWVSCITFGTYRVMFSSGLSWCRLKIEICIFQITLSRINSSKVPSSHSDSVASETAPMSSPGPPILMVSLPWVIFHPATICSISIISTSIALSRFKVPSKALPWFPPPAPVSDCHSCASIKHSIPYMDPFINF